MSKQRIESTDLDVSSTFHDFYVVPDYQREYVWSAGEVEQLLTDIHSEFEPDGGPTSDYFIGSVVVTKRPDETFELIDGQQRLTTIFILMATIRDALRTLDPTGDVSVVNSLIHDSSLDEDGNTVYRDRVELQYEDSSDVLVYLARDGKAIDGRGLKQTRSVNNIVTARKVSELFIAENFGDDVLQLRRFLKYLTSNVKLIRVKAESVAHALKIFETINDRGVGLDSMDLLKNLMFMNATSDQFEKLKTKWKRLVDELFDREKPLRFLRYFIFASYDVDRLREDEIYDWFVRNRDLCGYETDPLGFVDQLNEAAEAYVRFLDGRDPAGAPNRHLVNLRHLSGAARQHLILLLAGRHLPAELFGQLARHLENLFFAYIISREPTKEFERRFTQWAEELSAVSTQAELEAFLTHRFDTARVSLRTRFDLAFEELTESSLQKYRLRYVLAKLSQFVDEVAYGEGVGRSELAAYTEGGYEIEHVLPQNPAEAAAQDFDRMDVFGEYVGKLGNLTLLEKSINASISNQAFAHKRDAYYQSKTLLTRSLGGNVEVGVNTKIKQAVLEHLEPFDTWSSKDIDRRQLMLGRIARRVWDMDRIIPVAESDSRVRS